MGKVTFLSDKQKSVLEAVGSDNRFSSKFYFTGGTALAEFYLQHRESVDLDLFAQEKFETKFVGEAVDGWAKKLGFRAKSRYVDPVLIFDMDFGDGSILKVDFSYYPYKRLQEGEQRCAGIQVDSMLDIGVNKLMALTQRAEVKDFVDLYFLLNEFTFWDLREGVEKKFKREIDPYAMAADFLVVESFEYLPKMVKPLTLEELK
mgnify:CR=1 FL=1